MTRREIREEIFKLLFEYELIDNNIEKRINDVIEEEHLKKEDEIDFSKKRLSLWNNVKVKKLVKGWLKCDYRR